MISYSEALKIILNECKPIGTQTLSLSEANGYCLAKEVISAHNTPPFDQSAMDGYAFAFSSLTEEKSLILNHEVPAGKTLDFEIKPGEACRIFTGAPLPAGTDTVIMQEKVSLEQNKIILNDPQLFLGQNVRLKGSQTASGQLAMRRNQILNPAGISYLASLGIADVLVYSKPKIRIIVTGSELVKPGNKVSGGQIYESNSFGLSAAIKEIGLEILSSVLVNDDVEGIQNAIQEGLNSDILLLTGGVSVGDYDFVSAALVQCGVEKLFHKVKQKPGKPLFFGKRNNTLVFGLPGNPASVMSCYYMYVRPAIRHIAQNEISSSQLMPLNKAYTKKPGLTHFLKGQKGPYGVTILDRQESYLMNSFAISDCLVQLEEEDSECEKGKMVLVHSI